MIKRLRLSEPSAQMTDDTAAKKVRGRPFQPGNPGRPPGSKNHVTRLVEHLLANDAEKLTRTLLEKALSGDVKCLQFCLDRLSPRRNGRPVDFELPAITGPQDVVTATCAITTAVNDGGLTAEEAGHLVQVLESCAKAVMNYDITARLEKLEQQMRKKS